MLKLRHRFFWQLLAAFMLVIILAGGGVFLASSPNSITRGIFAHDISSEMTQIWSDHLADYYAQHGSWGDIVILSIGYRRAPWDDEYNPVDYILATAEGEIVAASDNARLGQSLSPTERSLATPIAVEDQQVGLLLLSLSENKDHPPLLTIIMFALLAVGGFLFVVGLARHISQPLVDLTAATQAVAGGDLSVRVPVRHRGEIRELEVAFNTMTERLSRADELRRNLTADIAHELRTPLSVVRGKVEGVLDGVYPASTEHLAPVLDEIKLLARLVEDLHLLSLAEAGQLPLEKHAIDIAALLRDAQVNFEPQADDRGVTLALDFPAQAPDSFAVEVMADGRRIAQVLGNLLTNALRHTPPEGRVTLSLSVSGGMARVSVADSGAGIPAEDLPHIFERFWRGEKSRSRAVGGAGLGLAIAKYLVEAHGGEIGVISPSMMDQHGEGTKGTMFYFTLPLASLKQDSEISPA